MQLISRQTALAFSQQPARAKVTNALIGTATRADQLRRGLRRSSADAVPATPARLDSHRRLRLKDAALQGQAATKEERRCARQQHAVTAATFVQSHFFSPRALALALGRAALKSERHGQPVRLHGRQRLEAQAQSAAPVCRLTPTALHLRAGRPSSFLLGAAGPMRSELNSTQPRCSEGQAHT
ncbi:hypothetical protein L1887_57894 [Cichorium endivia]|nr:hypothetical protein L1887_57894 [Cichorium endivia]